MVSPENERVFVTVSKDMLARIDQHRRLFGLSRSAYIASILGQGVLKMEKEIGITHDETDTRESPRRSKERGSAVTVDMSLVDSMTGHRRAQGSRL